MAGSFIRLEKDLDAVDLDSSMGFSIKRLWMAEKIISTLHSIYTLRGTLGKRGKSPGSFFRNDTSSHGRA